MKHINMIVVALIVCLLLVGCTPYKWAMAEEEKINLEVVVTEARAQTQTFYSAFSGMTRVFKHEVDCPLMSVGKVQATNGVDASKLWNGVLDLVKADIKVLFTEDGKKFARVYDGNFNRNTANWQPLTFVEVCRKLEDGAALVSSQQHYIRFE